MNFDFIRFRLNESIDYFKDQITYVSTDNGIDLYSVDPSGTQILFLGLSIAKINLYFYEHRLITLYIHLAPDPGGLTRVLKALEEEVGQLAKALEISTGKVYRWDKGWEIFGLVTDKAGSRLYLYLTLKEYNVFRD